MPHATLNDLTPETMTEFLNRLDQQERIGRDSVLRVGVARGTIRSYGTKLKTFCKWLVRRGRLKRNPFDEIVLPEPAYVDRKYLKRDDVERIFTAACFGVEWKSLLDKQRALVSLALLLHCGLRRGELLALKLLDIDMESRELTVLAENSKSRRQRIIPLNSSAMQALKDYLHLRRSEDINTPYLLVSTRRDGPMTAHSLTHIIDQLRAASGVMFHAHQFRHTFAVNLLSKGSDISIVQQLLGHTNIKVTALYLRSLPPHLLRPSVEKMSLGNLV